MPFHIDKMLRTVTEETWRGFVEKQRFESLFLEKSYITVISEVYDLDIRYYFWSVDNEVVLAFYVLVSGNSIVQPNHFHQFQPVFPNGWRGNLSAILADVLLILIQFYKTVSLKFTNDCFIDNLPKIRIEKRFTYVNKLGGEEKYSRNITRLTKKGLERGYKIIHSENFEQSFELIWHSYRAFMSEKKKKSFKNYLLNLEKIKKVEIFDLLLADNLIASLLVILDKGQQTFYTFLISIPDKANYPEAQSMLYTASLKHYEQLGFNYCDFSGANIPAVAKFKAKFKGDLKFYYQVYYTSNPVLKLKDFFKRKIALALILIKKKFYTKT